METLTSREARQRSSLALSWSRSRNSSQVRGLSLRLQVLRKKSRLAGRHSRNEHATRRRYPTPRRRSGRTMIMFFTSSGTSRRMKNVPLSALPSSISVRLRHPFTIGPMPWRVAARMTPKEATSFLSPRSRSMPNKLRLILTSSSWKASLTLFSQRRMGCLCPVPTTRKQRVRLQWKNPLLPSPMQHLTFAKRRAMKQISGQYWRRRRRRRGRTLARQGRRRPRKNVKPTCKGQRTTRRKSKIESCHCLCASAIQKARISRNRSGITTSRRWARGQRTPRMPQCARTKTTVTAKRKALV
eukprot:08681_3